MIKRSRFIVVCLFALFLPSNLLASGFFTPEVGARTAARGGADIAGAQNLTAIYTNPGALSRIKGTNFFLQNNFDFMHTTYQKEPYQDKVYNRNPLDVIQFLAVSSDFHLEDWTFAFGVYGPYGVTQRYPYNGPQRYTVLEANSVQIYYSLGIGWQPLRWLRIGADACLVNFSKEDYYGFSVLGERNPKYDVEVRFLAESEYIPSWSAGFILEPTRWFHLAFAYIPSFQPTLKGSLKADLPEFYAAILGFDTYEDKITVTIDYPPQYRAGIRFLFRDIFDVEAAVCYIPWSMLDTFQVDLEDEILMEDFELPLYWEDTWNYRFGGTWKVNNHWQIHGGYYWENPATPEETLGPGGVESTRNALSTGLTLSYFGIDFDFAYVHVWMEDRENNQPNLESSLDDGRGEYTGSFDHFIGAMNFNFEKLYYTFKGGPAKVQEKEIK